MTAPYRPEPNQDHELERLAAEGRARREGLAEVDKMAGARHLNAALGAYLGSSKSNLPLIVAALAASGILAAVLVGGWTKALGVIGVFLLFLSLMAYKLMPPIVSPAEMERERAWVASFPFALRGYFEVLSQTPQSTRTLVYELRWKEPGSPPASELLDGIVAAADPGARVEHVDGEHARVRSGPLSGETGVRINREPVCSNFRLPPNVHEVVEKALVPLHRSHALESVTLHGDTSDPVRT